MPFTHKISQITSYIVNNKENISYSLNDSQTSGAEANISESITNGTDQLVAYEMDISQLKTFVIWSSGGDMTVETNSSSAPDDTFNLTDGVPVFWSANMQGSPAIPLSADITALYVTNTGTATLEVRALFDPTV